jgi:hypothetical protein
MSSHSIFKATDGDDGESIMVGAEEYKILTAAPASPSWMT